MTTPRTPRVCVFAFPPARVSFKRNKETKAGECEGNSDRSFHRNVQKKKTTERIPKIPAEAYIQHRERELPAPRFPVSVARRNTALFTNSVRRFSKSQRLKDFSASGNTGSFLFFLKLVQGHLFFFFSQSSSDILLSKNRLMK